MEAAIGERPWVRLVKSVRVAAHRPLLFFSPRFYTSLLITGGGARLSPRARTKKEVEGGFGGKMDQK
jgi:hypothetical protein